jgi:hypothetical protein
MSSPSSAILKLIDRIGNIVDALNLAIDGKLKDETKLQYEKLKLAAGTLEDVLPQDFYDKTFSDFRRHLGFVGHYFSKNDFDWMKSNALDLKDRDLPSIKNEVYKFIKALGSETKPYCFKIGARCSKEIPVNSRQVFVGMPFRKKFEDVYRHGIAPVLDKYKLEPWKADEEPSNIDILCKICEHLQESQYAIMNITDWNANVLFEVGLAYGLGKHVILIKDKESDVPVDLKGMEYRQYESSEDLRKELEKFFSSIEQLA